MITKAQLVTTAKWVEFLGAGFAIVISAKALAQDTLDFWISLALLVYFITVIFAKFILFLDYNSKK